MGQNHIIEKLNEADSYSSPAMMARRRRILEETRKLIAEHGLVGFNLMELCRRADVAKQTLYYAFGSKEGLVAAAMFDHFEEYERRITYHAPAGSLERLIERMVAIGERNLKIPNHVGAITSFYYSQSASTHMRTMLHDITTLPQRPYIEALHKARQLQPWAEPELLIDALDDQRISIANQWIQGRIADEQMIDRMVTSVLVYLLGCVRGTARRHVEGVLTAIAKIGAASYVANLTCATKDQKEADGPSS